MVPTSSEQDTEKPEETASNADTGYETGSVLSTSSSSQITKVRHTLVESYLNYNDYYFMNVFMN